MLDTSRSPGSWHARKASAWFGTICIAFVAIFLCFSPNYRWSERLGSTPYGGDFLQEWVGGHMLATGRARELYTASYEEIQHDPSVVGFVWEEGQYFPAVYPPPHYLLFAPAALLPYRWAVVGWLTLLCASLWFSHFLISQLLSREASGSKHLCNVGDGRRAGLLFLPLILFPPTLLSIAMGQKSLLWLCLFCGVALLLGAKRYGAAGVVAGLLTIKPTLCFLLPLLMLRERNHRFLLGMVCSAIAIWGGAFLLLPMETWQGFLQQVRGAGSYTQHSGFRLDWSCNLLSLATSVPEASRLAVKFGICLTLGLYVLWTLFRKAPDWKSPDTWMQFILGTALLSPHFYHYDLCLLLLPILWTMHENRRRGLAYLVLLTMALFVSESVLSLWQQPLLPIILFGMFCEIRLRQVQFSSESLPTRPKTDPRTGVATSVG